jgi:hypothetical protein
MSGYAPLAGVISLSHFLLDGYSCICNHHFYYLSGGEISYTVSPNILRKIVSFVVINRFNDPALSTIIRDVGLIVGYYRAGAVIPRKLLGVFERVVGPRKLQNLAYIASHPSYDVFPQPAYTTAWSEYICVDFEEYHGFSVRVLGLFEVPLPRLRCEDLRKELVE